MAWLVAVPVTSFGEHGIEHCFEAFSAQQIGKTFHIMRHEPCVVANGSFCDECFTMHEVGVALEASVGMTTVAIARLWVDDVAPVL